jgi:hypothetical protein
MGLIGPFLGLIGLLLSAMCDSMLLLGLFCPHREQARSYIGMRDLWERACSRGVGTGNHYLDRNDPSLCLIDAPTPTLLR